MSGTDLINHLTKKHNLGIEYAKQSIESINEVSYTTKKLNS